MADLPGRQIIPDRPLSFGLHQADWANSWPSSLNAGYDTGREPHFGRQFIAEPFRKSVTECKARRAGGVGSLWDDASLKSL